MESGPTEQMDTGSRRCQKELQRDVRQKPRTSRGSEVEVTDQKGAGKSQRTVAHSNAIAFWPAWHRFFQKSDRILQIRSCADSWFHRLIYKETLQFIDPVWTRTQHETSSLKK